ncbi:Rho termination factor N-terminal domain-containing protein [Acidobacteria bacterium AH-259-D05]|nr:Rho termination factor N-terminal domain-containing protein [Acidobacteria bacterium AH-259-D05]
MELSFEDLSKKTVAQLREIAEGIEDDAVHGYRTMHKEQLVAALCKALGIEAHKHHVVVGVDKSKTKARIRDLKIQRDTALQAHDHKQLKQIRHQIHRLKHRLRKAMI